jgi:hypothetical protein
MSVSTVIYLRSGWTDAQLLQSLVDLPEFEVREYLSDGQPRTYIAGPGLAVSASPPLSGRARTLRKNFGVDFNRGINFQHSGGLETAHYLTMWRALLRAFLHLWQQTHCQEALTLTNGERVDVLWQDETLVLNADDPWYEQHLGGWLREFGVAYELKDIPY